MSSTPVSKNDYLIAVGRTVQNATLNESFMFTAFKIISGCSTATASAIFYTLDSFQGKKSLLMRTVIATGDPQDKQLIETIIQAAEKSNNQRRELAHTIALFATNDLTANPHAIFNPKKRRTQTLTKDWLSSLMGHSIDAAREGFQAFEQLCQKHKVPPQPEL